MVNVPMEDGSDKYTVPALERGLPNLLRQAILAGSSRLPPLKAAIVSQLTGRRPAWPTVAP